MIGWKVGLASDISKYQARNLRPNVGKDAWDPANWVVEIDWDVYLEQVDIIGIRVGDGLNKDPCFDRYVAAVTARRKAWFIYHLFRAEEDPEEQVAAILGWCPRRPPGGVFGDLELTGGLGELALFNRFNAYLLGLDAAYDDETGIYSGAWFMDPHFSLERQRKWAHRRGWWSGYPSLRIPVGWKEQPPEQQYVMHQFTDRYPFRGAKPHDANRPNPLVSLASWVRLEEEEPVPYVHPVPKGTLYGAHGESSNQIIPLIDKYRKHGVNLAAVIAVENPGLCRDAKDRGVPLTVARWKHPNPKYEGGGDGVHTWTPEERLDFARSAIQLIFDRTNDWEYAGCDFFQPGLNEWDAQTPEGWTAIGETLILLCQEASRRSPEMEARGLHPIRLCIPAFNAGSPKTWAMYQALVETGLFALMKQRGDILNFHEGVFFDQPIDFGMGDGPTGAPLLPGAGAHCFRSDYLLYLLRQRGEEVQYMMGEWYDGNTRSTPVSQRLAAMQWYERRLAMRAGALAFCAFELTDDPNGQWYRVDFTPVFQSDEMLQDMIAQKDRINPTGGLDMATREEVIAAAVAARDAAQHVLNLAEGLPATAWWHAWPEGIISPTRALKPTQTILNYYREDGSLISPNPLPRAVTWKMDVNHRKGNLLRVYDPAGTSSDLWVRAEDVQPEV